MTRTLVPAISPYAATVGYSRAVRVGGRIAVSGTAAIYPDGAETPRDPYLQAKRCLEIIVEALADLGAEPAHVVRTRIFLVRAEDADEVGRAHGEVFAEVRPASAMVVVSALLDPRWLVEIEAEAVVP